MRKLSVLIVLFALLLFAVPTITVAKEHPQQSQHPEHPQHPESPQQNDHGQHNNQQKENPRQNEHPQHNTQHDGVSGEVANLSSNTVNKNQAEGAKVAVVKGRSRQNKASTEPTDLTSNSGDEAAGTEKNATSDTIKSAGIENEGPGKAVRLGWQKAKTGAAKKNGALGETTSLGETDTPSRNADELETSSNQGPENPLAVDLIISPIAMAEPTTGGSPDDRDGSPPVSGSADPEEIILAAQIEVSVTLTNVVAAIEIRAGPDGVQDLFVDNDDPRDLGTLDPGIYFIYWSVHKDQSVAKKGHADQFQVVLTYDDGEFNATDWFTVHLEGSTSIKQNDLRWIETGGNLDGSDLTVVAKYQQMSQNILHSLIVQGFYDGQKLRLEDVHVYYYDTKIDPGSVAGGTVPGVPDQDWQNTLTFADADFPETMSSGDYWIVKYEFSVIGNSILSVMPYIQTKEAANANWKLDAGYIEFQYEPHIDLWVEKEGPATAEPGETYTYTINYGNRDTATADAEGVVIVDTLPDYGTPTNFGNGVYDPDADTITWDIGHVGVGESGQVSVEFTIPDVMPCGWTELVNNVEIYSIAQDEDCELESTLDDNTDALITTVEAHRDLWVEKEGPATAEPGETFTYVISYGNSGNADATNVTIVDQLDSFLTVVKADGITILGNTIIWALGTLYAGESFTGLQAISLQVMVDEEMPIGTTILTNIVIIDNDQPEECEEDFGNNEDRVDTTVEVIELEPLGEPEIVPEQEVPALIEVAAAPEAEPIPEKEEEDVLPYTGFDLILLMGLAIMLMISGVILSRKYS